MRELAYLNKHFARYKWHLLGGIVFVAISNTFAIFPAQIIRYAIDFVQDSLMVFPLFNEENILAFYSKMLTRAILLFSALVLFLALAKGFFLFLMRQTIIVMSRLMEYDLKNDIFQKYEDLHMAFYKQNNTGDLMKVTHKSLSTAMRPNKNPASPIKNHHN